MTFNPDLGFQNDAQAALAANNYELKKRRIAVTLSDPRVSARHRYGCI